MSNLHKDLSNSQIHNPKDFDGAAVSTKLTKNASGNLEWIADSGGGGIVTSLTTTGTSGASTLAGGVLNVPVYAPDTISHAVHNRCYGSLDNTNLYAMSTPSGNNEHKFTVDLGATGTTAISPKDAVQGAVYSITKTGETLKTWVGHICGTTGTSVKLSMWQVVWGDCQSVNVDIEMCLLDDVTLALTGNNTPICFTSDEITNDCVATSLGDIFVLTAELTAGEEANFSVETTMRFGL